MNQNEPIFLNLYIKDTKMPKTFVQSTTQKIAYEKNAKKMLNFAD